MGTVAGWKKYTSIVDSPSNGITFDCGVTREMGEDPVEVCRYFASRDRINHMHYRNVRVIKPYERYTEVAIDEGQVDMFGVMKELVRQKYHRTLEPEHPRAFDYDREYAKVTTGGPLRGYCPGRRRPRWHDVQHRLRQSHATGSFGIVACQKTTFHSTSLPVGRRVVHRQQTLVGRHLRRQTAG